MNSEHEPSHTQIEISVVVPLFNEQENLPELYRRLVRTLEDAGIEFELVLVNDGSRDATPHLLEELQTGDGRVVVIHLSRNFGHQAALCAGIDHTRGRAVVLMDGDLQDPPETLPEFVRCWRNGNEVVYAVRTRRKESLFKRACYALFYRLLRAGSDLDIPLDSGDFCLMDARVVAALRNLPERNRFVRGLRTFVGFRQMGLSCERAARLAGRPKYTFRALCRLAVDGLIGFTNLPLSLVTYAGCSCVVLTLLWSSWLGFRTLQQGELPGWGVATLAVLTCTSVQLLGLGIVSEYIRRIFLETKARPTYIVAALRQRSPDAVLAHQHGWESNGHLSNGTSRAVKTRILPKRTLK